jgi:gas vesicle protein
MSNRNSGAEFFAGLIIGGLIGAALSILLAPQSGEETRAQLRDKGLEFKDRAEEGMLEARHRAQKQMASLQEQVSSLQEQVTVLQEKGKETFEKGRQSASEAFARGKQAVTRHKSNTPEEA